MSDDKPVYLAGPIDAHDDPAGWRERLKERYPDVEFRDPVEKWGLSKPRDTEKMVEWDLEQPRTCHVLVYPLGSAAPRTRGTHHEIAVALENGQKVAVVPKGSVTFPFVSERVKLCYDLDSALEYLRGVQ